MKTISKERAEKIARNINAMDIHYQHSDDIKVWRFWNNLKNKLQTILVSLSDTDREIVTSLCNEDESKYFNLI